MVGTIRLSDKTYVELTQFKAWLVANGQGKGLSDQQQDFDWAVAWLLKNCKEKQKK